MRVESCGVSSGGLRRVALPPKPFVQQKRQLSRGMRGIYTVQAERRSNRRTQILTAWLPLVNVAAPGEGRLVLSRAGGDYRGGAGKPRSIRARAVTQLEQDNLL